MRLTTPISLFGRHLQVSVAGGSETLATDGLIRMELLEVLQTELKI